MRTITIAEHISLDGFIEPSERNASREAVPGGWTGPYRTPEGAAALATAYGKGFDLLLGRRTYDQWSGFWPQMRGGPFAENINAATKYVATHRPESLAWGPVGALGADALEGIRRLKAEDGPGLIVCGSASLVSVLIAQGLADELVLTVYPLLLGEGKRCFPDGADLRKFALVSSWATPTGVLLNRYRHLP